MTSSGETRRIALFSDVHGNLPALEAVLADIRGRKMAEVYCLGDLVGYGPDPSGVIAAIRNSGIPTVRGNYDDGIGHRRGNCGCYYANEQAESDGRASYAFTDAALNDDERAWLASLPDELRLGIDDLRLLMVHGSPRRINEYLLPDRSDEQLTRLAVEANADVVCVGHVHVPYHRSMATSDGREIHYVSSGSVGKPKDGDPRAAWVELILGTPDEVNASTDDAAAGPAASSHIWLGVVVHRVAYDVSAVVAAMASAGLPPALGQALAQA